MPAKGAREPQPRADRIELSRRLKAARFLAGRTSDGKGGVIALSVRELAQHPLLRQNDITKNRLDEYEQMKVDPRPYELRLIAEALGVEPGFLLGPQADDEPEAPAEDRLDRIERTLERLLEVVQSIERARHQTLARIEEQVARSEVQAAKRGQALNALHEQFRELRSETAATAVEVMRRLDEAPQPSARSQRQQRA